MELALLCLKIFFVRILDVSMGTARMIIVVKGKSLMASLIGLVEVFIWFMIVREALNTDAGGLWIAASYSLGFATGTFIGGKLSARFIKGTMSVQVITDDSNLDEMLREKGYGITVVNAEGHDVTKKRYILFIEIDNSKLAMLKDHIKDLDNNAFITASETKYVQNGFFVK